MFTGGNLKSFVASASLLLVLAAQANAHAIPVPALGVAKPARSDVQRPSTASPCGSVNIAQTIDTSTATPVAADGSVTIGVENFNAGGDGSTSVSVSVDATGKGTSFVAGTVTKNGNANPSAVETDQVTFTLPAGTTCTGGAAGNLCLVSVKTTAGFGACTVVSQGAGTAAAAGTGTAAAAGNAAGAGAAAAAAGAGAAAAAAGTTTTGTAATAGKKHHKGGKKAKAAAAAAAAAAGGAAPANAAVAKAGKAGKKTGRFAPRFLRGDFEGMLH